METPSNLSLFKTVSSINTNRGVVLDYWMVVFEPNQPWVIDLNRIIFDYCVHEMRWLSTPLSSSPFTRHDDLVFSNDDKSITLKGSDYGLVFADTLIEINDKRMDTSHFRKCSWTLTLDLIEQTDWYHYFGFCAVIRNDSEMDESNQFKACVLENEGDEAYAPQLGLYAIEISSVMNGIEIYLPSGDRCDFIRQSVGIQIPLNPIESTRKKIEFENEDDLWKNGDEIEFILKGNSLELERNGVSLGIIFDNLPKMIIPIFNGYMDIQITLDSKI